MLDTASALTEIGKSSGDINKISIAIANLTDKNKLLALSTLTALDLDEKSILLKAGVNEAIATEMLATKASTAAKIKNAGATNLLTVATTKLNAAIMAHPYIAIGAVLIATITAVFVAQKKYNEAVQASIDKADELVNAYAEANKTLSANSATIKSLSKDYKTLAEGVDNYGNNISLTEDEFKRYHEITSQIADMFPSMVQGYDEQGNAIIRNKGNVELLTEALKEQRRVANQDILDSSGDVFEGVKNEASNVQKEINDVSNAIKLLNGEKISTFDGTELNGVKEIINSKGLSGTFKIENYASDDALAIYSAENESLEEQKKKQEAINSLMLNKNNLLAEQETIQSKVNSVTQAYLNNNLTYNNLDKAQQDIISSLTSALNPKDFGEFGYDDDAMFDYIMNSIIIPINENKDNVQEAFKSLLTLDKDNMPYDEWKDQINTLAEQIAKTTESSVKDIKIAFGIDVDESSIDNMLNSLKNKVNEDIFENLSKLSFNDIELAYSIKNVGNLTWEEIQEEINKLRIQKVIKINVETNFKEAQKSYDEIIGKISELQKLQKSIAEDGLTQDSVNNIIKNYPELLGYMNDATLLQQQINEKIREQEVIATQTQNQILDNSTSFYKQMSSQVANLISNYEGFYKVDLANCTSLAEAKLRVEAQLVANLSSLWAKHFSTVYNENQALDLIDAIQNGSEKYKGMEISSEQFAFAKDYFNKAQQSREIVAQLDSLKNEALDKMKAGLGSGSIGGGSKSGGGSGSSDNGLSKIIETIKKKSEEIDNEISKLEEQLSFETLLGNMDNVDKINSRLEQLYKSKPDVLKDQEKELQALTAKFTKEEDTAKLEKEISSTQKDYYSATTDNLEFQKKLIEEKYKAEEEGYEETRKHIDFMRNKVPETSEQAISFNLEDISNIGKIIAIVNEKISDALGKDFTLDSDFVKELQDKLLELEDEKFDLELKNLNIKFDLSDKVYEEVEDLKDELKSRIETAEFTGNAKVALKLTLEIKDLNNSALTSIESEIDQIQAHMNTLPKISTEYEACEERINSLLEKRRSLLSEQIELIKKSAEIEAEKSVYGSKGKDKWKKSNQSEIDALKEELSILNKKDNVEEKDNAIQDKIKDIEELEKKLKNLKETKEIQVLTKDENGDWQWDYIADYEKVAETEKDITENREELEKLYEEKRKEEQIAFLEEQIAQLEAVAKEKEDYYQKEYDKLVEQGTKELKERAKQGSDQKTQTEANYSNIDQATKNGLTNVDNSTQEGLGNVNASVTMGMNTMYTNYSNWLGIIYSEVRRMMEKIRDEMADVPSDVGSSNTEKSVPTNSISLMSDTNGFKTGGLNTQTGFQLLHGTQNKPERVLSSEQTKNFDYMITQLPNLNKAIDKICSNKNQEISNSITIQNITLPKVQNPTNFIDELYKVMDGVSFQAKVQGVR